MLLPAARAADHAECFAGDDLEGDALEDEVARLVGEPHGVEVAGGRGSSIASPPRSTVADVSVAISSSICSRNGAVSWEVWICGLELLAVGQGPDQQEEDGAHGGQGPGRREQGDPPDGHHDEEEGQVLVEAAPESHQHPDPAEGLGDGGGVAVDGGLDRPGDVEGGDLGGHPGRSRPSGWRTRGRTWRRSRWRPWFSFRTGRSRMPTAATQTMDTPATRAEEMNATRRIDDKPHRATDAMTSWLTARSARRVGREQLLEVALGVHRPV